MTDTPPFIENNGTETVIESVMDNDLDNAINTESVLNNINASAPLSNIDNYVPASDVNIISEITPANFDNLMKVLNVLIKEKSTDKIIIRQSKISQMSGTYTVMADMTSVLNYKGTFIDLDIANPKKYVSLFSQFRDKDNIFIIDDSTNNRYIITNGEIELFLPKVDQQNDDLDNGRDLTTATKISDRKIDKETRKIIKSLSKDEEYIEYLIQNNQIKAMHIPNIAKYVYQEFKNDEDTKKLDETNADLSLRTSGFLPVEADNYDLTLYQLSDGNYISLTTCKIGGQIDVTIIEDCTVTTGGNLLF